MKKSSKKTSGLLGGFDFQPVFSEQTLSRSEPEEEEVSQAKPNEAKQAQIKPSDAADSHTQPSEAELSSIKPKQAEYSESQPSDAVLGEGKPKKLKQAKEVQRLIEQGDVTGALAEAGLTKKNPDAGIPSGRLPAGSGRCHALWRGSSPSFGAVLRFFPESGSAPA